MTTPPRTQRTYDHRLKELVCETGDIRLATKQGVPRSTARGWLWRPRKEVGRGKLAPEEIDFLFESRDRRLSGPTAPARGLQLMRVDYSELICRDAL